MYRVGIISMRYRWMQATCSPFFPPQLKDNDCEWVLSQVRRPVCHRGSSKCCCPICCYKGIWRKHDDAIKRKHFRVTGHLCEEFTGYRWIPRTKASDAELWCFFDLRLNKRLGKQWCGWRFEMPPRPLWRHCNVSPRVIEGLLSQLLP